MSATNGQLENSVNSEHKWVTVEVVKKPFTSCSTNVAEHNDRLESVVRGFSSLIGTKTSVKYSSSGVI